MSKITDALNAAGKNFARPNKYNVLVSPPPQIPVNKQYLDILCTNVTLPEIVMQPVEIHHKGHLLKLPGRVNQEQTIQMSFYMDEYHTNRQVFVDWISAIDNRYYGMRSRESASMYSFDLAQRAYGNLVVIARDFTEKEQAKVYVFENVFPISVSGPEFSTSSQNEVMTFNVTFAYYRYLSDGENMDDLDSVLDTFGMYSQNTSTGISVYNRGSGDIVSGISNMIGTLAGSLGSLF